MNNQNKSVSPGILISVILVVAGGFMSILGIAGIYRTAYPVHANFLYDVMSALPGEILKWVAGITLIAAGWASFHIRRESRIEIKPLLPILLFIVPAALFRYFGMDYLPWGDEVCATPSKFVAEDAFILGENGLFPIWHPETGIFFLYYIHAGFKLIGARSDIFAILLPAVGIIGIAVATAWAAGILKTRAALALFTFVFSFSAIDSIIFASPLAYSHTNLWIIAVLALLLTAVEKNRTSFFIPAGLAYGLGPFTSLSFLTLFPIPLVYLAWSAAAGDKRVDWKRGFPLFIACSLLTAAPFLITLAVDEKVVTGRIQRNTAESQLVRDEFGGNQVARSLRILQRSIEFYVTGDPSLKDTNEQDFMGDNTPLRPWMIPLLLPGIILALGKRRNGALLAVILLAISPVFICAANRIINGRLVTGLPALYLLSVLPLDDLLTRKGKKSKRLATFLFVFLLIGGTIYDAVRYFQGMGIDRSVNYPSLLLAEELERRDNDEPIYFTFNCGNECRLNPGLFEKRCLEINKCYEFRQKYYPLDPRAELSACGNGLYFSPDLVLECLKENFKPGESRFKLIFPPSDDLDTCTTSLINSLENFAVPSDTSFIDVSQRIQDVHDVFPVIELEILHIDPER